MISTELSQQLLAKEFWQNYRWLGRQNSHHKLKKSRVNDWHFSYVQDFFQNANWSGSQNNLIRKTVKQINLDISLTTTQFFQCFSWEGERKIAPNNINREINTEKNCTGEEKKSTLSELSQLF